MKHITRENLNKIIELRHLLHSRPELSLQESMRSTIRFRRPEITTEHWTA